MDLPDARVNVERQLPRTGASLQCQRGQGRASRPRAMRGDRYVIREMKAPLVNDRAAAAGQVHIPRELHVFDRWRQ
jgi:hypothetical protein